MIRFTPTAPMPSEWNSAVAVVRIRSRGLGDTMGLGFSLPSRGNERTHSLSCEVLSSQREQQLLGLLQGGGGADLAEEGHGPLQLDPALGRAGGEQPAGRGPGGARLGGGARPL